MSEVRGELIEAGSKLLGSLPAQFLALLVLNVIFIGGVLWFIQSEDATHGKLVAPILASCAQSVPIEALAKLGYLPKP